MASDEKDLWLILPGLGLSFWIGVPQILGKLSYINHVLAVFAYREPMQEPLTWVQKMKSTCFLIYGGWFASMTDGSWLLINANSD